MVRVRGGWGGGGGWWVGGGLERDGDSRTDRRVRARREDEGGGEKAVRVREVVSRRGGLDSFVDCGDSVSDGGAAVRDGCCCGVARVVRAARREA